jgi:Septum formation
VGDCLNEAPPEDASRTEVADVPAVPCEQEHAGEVYHTFELDDADAYPGYDEVSSLADEECIAQFEAFVGLPYNESRLDYWTLVPSDDTWNNLDDREVVCIVGDPQGPLIGSARGLGQSTALVGSCLDENGEPVDCASPHDSELYALVDLPDGPWPGQKEVDAASEQPCLDQFAGYVGVSYDDSALDFGYVTPDEESWGAGDRQVWCIVGDPAGPLTGSVRGSGQ